MEAAQSASSSGRKYRTECIMSGRLYRAHDMARIASTECAGCGACCRGMGDTIVLDPYDVWQLAGGTGKTFEELMGAGIDLHVEEGVILPHLMMREDTKGCFFLGEDGKCADPCLPARDLQAVSPRQESSWRQSLLLHRPGRVLYQGNLPRPGSTSGSESRAFPPMSGLRRIGISCSVR